MKKISVLIKLSVSILFFANCHPKMYAAADKTKTTTTTTVTTIDKPATATLEKIALGKTIYDAECNKCHDLPKPGDYKMAEWADILPKMIAKANMDRNKGELVTSYVKANVKPQ